MVENSPLVIQCTHTIMKRTPFHVKIVDISGQMNTALNVSSILRQEALGANCIVTHTHITCRRVESVLQAADMCHITSAAIAATAITACWRAAGGYHCDEYCVANRLYFALHE
jgi:hypothetical protein